VLLPHSWRNRLHISWPLLTALTLLACGPAPPPHTGSHQEETQAPWYKETVDQLAAQNRETKDLLKRGKADAAAALIQKGEPMASRLLAVPKPTLAAMESASDLDDLYGRMLLSNRNYGWARLFFQKNLARWKNWTPQTPETAARLKEAQAAIAECDRGITY
jgi:hypothetical protein